MSKTKAAVLLSLVAVSSAGNQNGEREWSSQGGAGFGGGHGGGVHVKQGLLLKPVTEQVGPAPLTTIKKFIAHIDTSVVPIRFEHIRIPNSFGISGGEHGVGGSGFGGGGGHGGWKFGGSGGGGGWSLSRNGGQKFKVIELPNGGGQGGGWVMGGGEGGGWPSGGGGWMGDGNSWINGGGGWMGSGSDSFRGGHGGGFGGFPMLLDVPVQVHHNQFKSQAPVEKVFKAIPVQVKVAESQETGGHGGGGGGHNGWH
ncbi:glycine-rich cell wall structural protein 1-like isoform X1 [Varroa jacobsoni]|uniref:glycine-rich cell wall structural protein 1-like isoform X1 n=1 Tax=Varroa jacobsoni TaxID=62625 RepID=UPI000BFA7B88|nr:glycine-rich cell wall structural protein 1-like isoform X1 [Varroa jacobsoni]